MLDVSLLAFPLAVVLISVTGALAGPELATSLSNSAWFQNPAMASILSFGLCIPANAVFVGLTGSSPGKWMFGLRVVTKDYRTLGVGRALAREIHVFIIGLGFALPLVNLLTMSAQYNKLGRGFPANWDEGDSMVLYRNQTPLTMLRVTAGVILLFVLIGMHQIASQALKA